MNLQRTLLLLLAWISLHVLAETRVYPPEALEDMGVLSKEAFDEQWPATEVQDTDLSIDQGFWVAYRHLELTILIGPYEDKVPAEQALTRMEAYRTLLMMGQAQKFGSSTLALLENHPAPGSSSPASLPPGPLSPEEVISLQKTATTMPPAESSAPSTPPSGQQGGVGYGMISTPPSILKTLPRAYPPFLGRPLSPEADLSKRFPPAGNQAPQNACSGWAVGYALKSYHEAVEEGWSARSWWRGVNLANTFSPSYIYNQINGGNDQGAMLPVALSLVQSSGVCRWPRMAFEPSDYTSQPTELAHVDAERYRIEFFGSVPAENLDAIKGFLAGGFPLVVGMKTDADFEALKKDEVWSTVDPASPDLHAVILTGYDDRKEAFQVFNSWGKAWGRNGFGWISYDLWPNIALEVFAAKDARNDSTAPKWGRNGFTLQVDHAHPTASKGLQVEGTMSVPEGYPGEIRVVVALEDEQGQPILGTDKGYRTVEGHVAGRTLPTRASWSVEIPAKALPEGSGTGVFARAILYLDDFGLTASEAVRISN